MSPHTYTPALARETPRRWEFKATDHGSARAWQAAFRPELARLLGLPRIAERGPVGSAARRLSIHELPDHAREEWALETEPGVHVRFSLLRPHGTDGALPLVLTPHGHGVQGRREYVGDYASEEDRALVEAEELDVALQAVREGYLALAPEMRAFGESRLAEDAARGLNSSCQPLAMRALLFGRTLLGERVWDVRRLLDWALALPEVDPDRIVATGNSGGGTVTLFTAALDERVRVCVPVCSYCTFADSIGAIRHCECNYVPGLLEAAEMADVAALVAPRPFLAVNGARDPIFPIAATRASVERLRATYRVLGAEDRCRLRVGDGGHRYYKDLVWPFVREALRW